MGIAKTDKLKILADYFGVSIEYFLEDGKEVEQIEVNEAIKYWRKKRGLTQKQLGEKLGVSYQAICFYEKGKRNPKIENIKRIAEALEIPVSYIIKLETNELECLEEFEDKRALDSNVPKKMDRQELLKTVEKILKFLDKQHITIADAESISYLLNKAIKDSNEKAEKDFREKNGVFSWGSLTTRSYETNCQ